jgi:hypothetical protein
MKKAEIDAVKLVRTIRDRHGEELQGKTAAQIVAFYNSSLPAARQPVTKPRKKPRRSA